MQGFYCDPEVLGRMLVYNHNFAVETIQGCMQPAELGQVPVNMIKASCTVLPSVCNELERGKSYG